MSVKAIQRLKDEIATLQMGLDTLRQSEKPTSKLNQIVLQAMIENDEKLVRSCEEATPFVASYHAYAPEVLTAMDLPWYGIAATPVTMPGAMLQQQIYECDNLDIPADLCTVIRLSINQIEKDYYPPPTASIAMITPCDGTLMVHQVLAKKPSWRNVPSFAPDPPYLDDERAMNYYTREFHRMVAFLEEHTSKHLDVDKLREVVSESNKQYKLWAEYNELRRAVPCPHGYKIGAQIWTMVTMLWPGDTRCTAWLEELVDDTEQLVHQGIGATPEENIRLFWYDLRPFWMYEFGSWLENEWGAVVVMDMITYNPYTLVDTSTEETMLRDLAKRSLRDALMVRQERGLADIVIEDITRVVKDYKIDCVIWPAHMGHKAKAGVVGIGREICRELGVPFLQLDLDIFDPRYTTSDEIKDQISQFFNTMEIGKKRS